MVSLKLIVLITLAISLGSPLPSIHGSAHLPRGSEVSDDTDSAHILQPRRAFTDSNKIPLEHDSAHFPRVIRAVENLNTSVDRLKAVARVATGIYLTQELIKGTDKQEKITSELLKMGSATPAEIIGMNASDVQNVIKDLKEMPSRIDLSYEMKNVLKNAEIGVIVKKNYANVTSITSWSEQSAFESTLNDISSNGVNDPVIRALIPKLSKFSSDYFSVKATGLIAVIDDLVLNLPRINAAVQFSSSGRASDGFSRIIEIIRSLDSLSMVRGLNPQDASIEKALNIFFEVGNNLTRLATDVKNVNELIKTRNLPGSLRQLVYTTGMFQGQEDLSIIHSDLNDQWMKGVVNSDSFEKSMDPLRQLNISMRKAENRFKSFDEKAIAIFDELASETGKFARISSKRSKILPALQSVATCLSGVVGDYNKAKTVKTKVEQLDALFINYRSNIQKAIQIVQEENIITKLEKLKAELVKPENQVRALRQIFPNGEQDGLYDRIYELEALVNDDSIKSQCNSISGLLNNVTTSLGNATSNHGHLRCIADLADLDFVDDFHDLFKSVQDPSRPDYQNATITVANVKSSLAPLDDVFNAMSQIKGFSSEESKRLALLGNPQNVSDQIGNAVRGVGEVQKATEAIPAMKEVVKHQTNLTVTRLALQEKLEPTEVTLLKTLEKLDFPTLITELNAFKSTVDLKPFRNLQDSSFIFTEAEKLNGVEGDLAGMLKALDKLMALSTDPLQLKSMRIALAELRNIQLDFKKFHQYYEPAKTSMKNLEAFFANYASSMAEIQKEDDNAMKNGRKVTVGVWKKEKYFPQVSSYSQSMAVTVAPWSDFQVFIVFAIFAILFAACLTFCFVFNVL